ncbi:MerR family transcriptional regulator [Shouchella miscanthi]|uniref:MerR family transcriptional regulator n=1 Tax=Shouchella miscanthi TaxID=2598861 RepID=A0ABU6NTT0_9BACI|nr:MerR family transcriptional regulator [Shouchella miscanthi]
MQRITYKTSELLEMIGVSRDALRYYENQGILKPKQDERNHYRQYRDKDIYTLLVTDFYKKRSLSLKDIKKLQEGTEMEELESLLQIKEEELVRKISRDRFMLQKLRETKSFCKDIEKHLNKYSIREFPMYQVVGNFSDFYSFPEYPIILEHLDMIKDDILSKIIRQFTFDKDGLLDSKMYIVNRQKHDTGNKAEHDLNYKKCIYTVVEDSRFQGGTNDIKQKLFKSTLEWAEINGFKPKGLAFVQTRLITYIENDEKVFLEVYIPVDN